MDKEDADKKGLDTRMPPISRESILVDLSYQLFSFIIFSGSMIHEKMLIFFGIIGKGMRFQKKMKTAADHWVETAAGRY